MPLFDVQCVNGHEGEQFAHRVEQLEPCRTCGATVERTYRSFAHVRQDSIPGGMMVENLGPTPIRVNSWSEYRLELKRHGVVNMVQHVGVPGTDKSPMTSRWI